jgi:ABC-type Fe3+/spermidine/putrescine transport system ATPase subunit
VGIIYQGDILQVGTPREVLERPRNTRVARFMQAGNLFPARAQRQGPWLRLATGDGPALLAATNGSQPESGLVQVMIRPENVRLGASPPASPPPGSTVLEGTIAEVIDMGPVVSVRANCRGSELGVLSGKREFAELGLAIGQTVYLTVSADDVHVMGQ